jgi:hypothetical protein
MTDPRAVRPHVPAYPPVRPPDAWRVPSGLFPSGPPRPTYREPHPVRLGAVGAGAGATTLWLALVGLLVTGARAYAWATVVGGVLAAAVAVVLVRFGDRGVATGVALAAGFGVAVPLVLVTVRWIEGSWLLW